MYCNKLLYDGGVMKSVLLLRRNHSLDIQTITLEDGHTTFGRYDNSDISLGEPSVSRDHGAFYQRFNLLMVEDHGSRNGTTVNGEPIKRKVLYANDVVDIGPFQIFVREGTLRPDEPESNGSLFAPLDAN